MVKLLPATWKTWVGSLDRKDPLEKEMAPHSSILAWKIPWTEEPDGLQSMGSQSQTRLRDFTLASVCSSQKREKQHLPPRCLQTEEKVRSAHDKHLLV